MILPDFDSTPNRIDQIKSLLREEGVVPLGEQTKREMDLRAQYGNDIIDQALEEISREYMWELGIDTNIQEYSEEFNLGRDIEKYGDLDSGVPQD